MFNTKAKFAPIQNYHTKIFSLRVVLNLYLGWGPFKNDVIPIYVKYDFIPSLRYTFLH